MELKICNSCNSPKELNCFKQLKNSYQNRCKDCSKMNCNICINGNEWEQGRDHLGKPNSKDMDNMINLMKKEYKKK